MKKISSRDLIKIQFNNSPLTFTLEQVVIKFFEYINSAVVTFTEEKVKHL